MEGTQRQPGEVFLPHEQENMSLLHVASPWKPAGPGLVCTPGALGRLQLGIGSDASNLQGSREHFSPPM